MPAFLANDEDEDDDDFIPKSKPPLPNLGGMKMPAPLGMPALPSAPKSTALPPPPLPMTKPPVPP